MGFALSELIRLIGDEHVEVHPLGQCLTGGKTKKGVTTITLAIQTDKISLGDLAGYLPMAYSGFVILFPKAKADAALQSWKEQAAR
jgi:hypothetical protein